MQEYASIAELYAVDFAAVRDDVDFYRSLARRTKGPILEFMCGTGRVAIPLAKSGYAVTGIDSSPEMLAVAQRAHDQDPSIPLTLHHGDIRNWASDTRYSLAIVALNSFMHMLTVEDQLDALGTLHAALRPTGTLVIDLFNPDVRALPDYHGDVMLDKTFPLPDGRTVQKFVAQWADVAQQLINVVFMYDITDSNQRVQRHNAAFAMRWLWRYEVEHLLARAGFQVEAIYGDYELNPYESTSEQIIVVARKSKRNRNTVTPTVTMV